MKRIGGFYPENMIITWSNWSIYSHPRFRNSSADLSGSRLLEYVALGRHPYSNNGYLRFLDLPMASVSNEKADHSKGESGPQIS